MLRLLPPAVLLLLSACAAVMPVPLPALAPSPPVASQAAAEARAPVTILVSIDGFRSDYLDRGVTPVLSRLAAGGVSAPMRPSFPTKTFPNHWTLVTGLVPDRHGIVGNTMEDPARPGETFTMATENPFWWNAAEPVWVTAEKAGIRTATELWPGSSVAWGGRPAGRDEAAGGTRPSEWHQFAGGLTGNQRVDAVIDWLRRPASTRPRFLTLYLDTVDHAGHDFGPDAPELNAAVADADRVIGRLVAGLAELDQPANLVIVSDHGMAATSSERVIPLDRLLPAADYRLVESGTYAALNPLPGRTAAVRAALIRPHAHMTCWDKAAIPERLHYGRNPRVPAILCVTEPGWLVQTSAPAALFKGGNHGYDDAAPEMRALFVANGPAFRPGVRLREFPNTDVAPLVRRLLRLPVGKGLDGTDHPFDKALRP